MSPTAANATADRLQRDLALVLPEVRPAANSRIGALIAGKETTLDEAIDGAAELINASRAPAIIGLNHLTIEAVREAVALAEKMRGRLLSWPAADPVAARQSVVQTASLGHVLACERIIWVGGGGDSGPIARRIAERKLPAASVQADVATVVGLRATLSTDATADPIGNFKRVATVLAPDCDVRAASQWHKLAAQVQQSVRLCVFPLPHPDAANARGANEVVTWQTGLSLTAGGVDFADGAPRPCTALEPSPFLGRGCRSRPAHRCPPSTTGDPDASHRLRPNARPLGRRLFRHPWPRARPCRTGHALRRRRPLALRRPFRRAARSNRRLAPKTARESGDAGMNEYLRIANGRVFDPANAPAGKDGAVRDILIADGKIVAAFPPDVRPGSVKTIDATGMVVMPGGVDIHCHIASSAVNRARAMQGEEHATHLHPAALSHGHNFRGGSGVLTPSTFVTGYHYAALGYTTALEAAVSPWGARQTHLELDDTPNLDAGFLLLLANHHGLIELLDRNDQAGATAFVAHLLRQTGASVRRNRK